MSKLVTWKEVYDFLVATEQVTNGDPFPSKWFPVAPELRNGAPIPAVDNYRPINSEFPNCPAAYVIKNDDTGEAYIGSTKRLNKRKINHLCDLNNNRHGNAKLQLAFNGNANLLLGYQEVDSKEEALRIEQRLLDANKDHDLLMNYRLKAISNFSVRTYSAEDRAKLSERSKSKWTKERRDETVARMGSRVISDETRAKLSASAKIRASTDEYKASVSAVHKGKKISQESIDKMIVSKKAWSQSDEGKRVIANTNRILRERAKRPEVKARYREMQKLGLIAKKRNQQVSALSAAKMDITEVLS